MLMSKKILKDGHYLCYSDRRYNTLHLSCCKLQLVIAQLLLLLPFLSFVCLHGLFPIVEEWYPSCCKIENEEGEAPAVCLCVDFVFRFLSCFGFSSMLSM